MRISGPGKTISLLLLLSTACAKDDGPDDTGSGGVTPWTADLPQWVADSIGPMPIPDGSHMTWQGVALGRRLFYDKRLSDDESMACATCHLQADGFSDPLAFSVGTDGSVGTRNAMAVINL